MKLCTPSFIIPATRVENVRYLSEKVDEVQLLYFDSRHHFDIPEESEVKQLIAEKMSYSIHMPTDIDLNTDSGWDVMRKFYKLLEPLKPTRCVIHPENSEEFIRRALSFKGETGANIIVENTTFYGSFFDEVTSAGLKLCFDNAHAFHHGEDVLKFIDKYKSDIAEYHLQGHHDGKDHKSLSFLDKGVLEYIAKCAKLNDSVINIEVFNEKDFLESYEIIKRYL